MFHLHAFGNDIADFAQVQTGTKSRSFVFQLPDRGLPPIFQQEMVSEVMERWVS